MTVTTQLNYKEYAANGIATTYTIPFLLIEPTNIAVFLDGKLFPQSTYKINGAENPQSEIVFYTAPKGKLLLQRTVEPLRNTDYQENGDLLAKTLNKDMDKIYLLMQGTSQNNSQSLKVTDPEGIDSLPLADKRANKILAFDGAGQPNLITAQTGSAAELAIDLLDNTKPDKGAGLIGFNPELDYPANTLGHQITELKDNIIPMFTTLWWPSRDSIPVGFVAADGQELPILTYIDAANAIASGTVPTIAETDWINDPTKRGCYVATSRNGFFRMPDYNGSYADSLGALFLRGGNGTLSNGAIQKDGVGNVKVPVGYSNYKQAFGADSADNKTRLMPAIDVNANGGYNNHGALGIEYKEALSSINLGTTETRPLNITGCFIIRLFGAVTEIGKADASKLLTDYAAIAARISLLEGINTAKRFTIIYPNGGSKANPANIATNSRYIIDNPFPNDPVFCELEVYVGGVWGTTGWIDNYGVSANHQIETDKIIIQTGAKGIAIASNRVGGSLGLVTPDMTTVPCRIKVWRAL